MSTIHDSGRDGETHAIDDLPIVAGRIFPDVVAELAATQDAALGVVAGEPHGPLAASLSERTLEKVLSRPAHVPSLVMLDRDAAARHLADVVSDTMAEGHAFQGTWRGIPMSKWDTLRQALADYRETTA